jgi:hypothetical protein
VATHFKWGTEAFPCPEYYPLAASARFWNVPPWVMMEQPIYWQDIAGIVSQAEASAQKIIAAHS